MNSVEVAPLADERADRRPRVQVLPTLPEPGQVVEVRGSTWAVANVQAQGLPRSPADDSSAQLSHVVDLQSLDEDRPGEQLSSVTVGHLTGEFHALARAARISITCATYNFEKTFKMWTVLHDAAEQPGVAVTIYVDGDKADASKVKAQIPQATIYRSAELLIGKRVVSHAKFSLYELA